MSGRNNLNGESASRSRSVGTPTIKTKCQSSASKSSTAGKIQNKVTANAKKPPNMNAKVVLDGSKGTENVSNLDEQLRDYMGEGLLARNETLLALAAYKIKNKEKAELENSIQSQLNTISKRLTTDQKILGELEHRLSEVKFLLTASEKLDKQEGEMSKRLEEMEKSAESIEKISTAAKPHLDYLRTKNIDIGPSINAFKEALTSTVKLLEGKGMQLKDGENLAETVESISSANKSCLNLDKQMEKLHAMMPACEDAVLTASTLEK